MMEKPGFLPRIACLDGVRAVAALMVMTFHFLGRYDETPWLRHAAAVGQTGVDLFFVLSGFLITRILLSSKESARFFRTFYTRRALRIFPLYYGFLVVFYFLLPFLGAENSTFRTQWWTWLYLQDIPATFPQFQSYGPNQFWSLAVEEHFYLVWPLAVRVLSRRNFGCVVVAALIAPLVLRLVFVGRGIEVAFFTLTRLDALGYGALLAVLLNGEKSGTRSVPVFRVSLVVLPMLLLSSFVMHAGDTPGWVQAISLSLIPAGYCAVIGFCVVDPAARILAAFLSVRWLRWLGAISFGLYVFHPTCFALVDTFVHPAHPAAAAAMSFGLTILVASLSFRCFESPILRLKNRFRYDLPGPDTHRPENSQMTSPAGRFTLSAPD